MESQGIHGTGTNNYTPEQYALVCAIVRRATVDIPITVAQLAEATKLSGNTIRAIVRAADGVEFVLGASSQGYKVATTALEAERGTWKLTSQILSMKQRAKRRNKYVQEHLT